jgi:hypothetical protein
MYFILKHLISCCLILLKAFDSIMLKILNSHVKFYFMIKLIVEFQKFTMSQLQIHLKKELIHFFQYVSSLNLLQFWIRLKIDNVNVEYNSTF